MRVLKSQFRSQVLRKLKGTMAAISTTLGNNFMCKENSILDLP